MGIRHRLQEERDTDSGSVKCTILPVTLLYPQLLDEYVNVCFDNFLEE